MKFNGLLSKTILYFTFFATLFQVIFGKPFSLASLPDFFKWYLLGVFTVVILISLLIEIVRRKFRLRLIFVKLKEEEDENVKEV